MHLFRTYYVFYVKDMVLVLEAFVFSWRKEKKLKRTTESKGEKSERVHNRDFGILKLNMF